MSFCSLIFPFVFYVFVFSVIVMKNGFNYNLEYRNAYRIK